MKITRILFLLILFLNMQYSMSQDIDSIYGLNPVLYNGQIYTYYVPNSVSGNQYLHDDVFNPGIVNIDNTDFDSIYLNYDIYNQEIILSFNLDKRLYLIKLSKNRVDNFSIGKEYFELIQDGQGNYYIYQVIGNGNYRILYQWRKWLEAYYDNKSGSYRFTQPIKTMFLKADDKILKYKNNRTFLSLFDNAKKQQVKNYLRQNKINIKKASDVELDKLIELCNSL